MIISHKHKFIFIKTHKTAGTSIEIALSSICGEEDIITPISPKDERERFRLFNIGYQNIHAPIHKYSISDLKNSIRRLKLKEYHRHSTARKIKSYIHTEIWNNYFKFSIERNPYDRIVSLFYWRGGFENYQSVYEFLINTKKPGLLTTDKYCINGKMAIDKVYQYENLNFMFADLSERLQLSQPLKLTDYKAKSFTRKEQDYRKVLDPEAKTWIDENCADVIERFGYEW